MIAYFLEGTRHTNDETRQFATSHNKAKHFVLDEMLDYQI